MTDSKLFDLHGKVALVTGATQGLGMAMAKGLGAAGATLVINGNSSQEKIGTAVAAFTDAGLDAHGYRFDVTNEDEVESAVAKIEKSHLRAARWFSTRPDVAGVRALGSVFALDVVDSAGGYLSSLGPFLYDEILSRDVLLRPIGNTVYILPPYCIHWM